MRYLYGACLICQLKELFTQKYSYAPQRQDAGHRLPGSTPGKALLICGKNPFLDFTDFIEVPVVCEGLNDLRHTAYIAVQLQQVGIVPLKYDGGHVKVAPPQQLRIEAFSHGHKKLGEGKKIQVEKLRFSNREGSPRMQLRTA